MVISHAFLMPQKCIEQSPSFWVESWCLLKEYTAYVMYSLNSASIKTAFCRTLGPSSEGAVVSIFHAGFSTLFVENLKLYELWHAVLCVGALRFDL